MTQNYKDRIWRNWKNATGVTGTGYKLPVTNCRGFFDQQIAEGAGAFEKFIEIALQLAPVDGVVMLIKFTSPMVACLYQAQR
jgi:hypothetical protein